MTYEYDFDPNEQNNTAAAVYRQASRGGQRVLDLGSGPGIVAARLAATGKHLTCVDRSPESLDAARSRGIGQVVEADLAAAGWVEQLPDHEFDVIVMADLLEHLIDPGALLQTIADQRVLADDGRLVISIPNAAHEAVLAELIKGRFTYQDTGLLDSTHLRFFTLASLRDLLERFGFFITTVERTKRTAEQTTLADNDVSLPRELRNRLLEAAEEAQTYQFIVTAERADAATTLAEVRQQLQTTRAQLAERERIAARDRDDALAAEHDAALTKADRLESELADAMADKASLEHRLSEMESALERERRLTATERKRYERMLADAKRTAGLGPSSSAAREIARLERKLADVYSSRTWKVGRAAWTAFHAPARLLRRSKPEEAASEPLPVVPTPGAAEYTLVENTRVRAAYEQALERRTFSGDKRNVVFAVYTTDLDEGRGDLYTAIGLGRQLQRIGFEAIYLPRDLWYELPTGTDVVIAMLETVDATQLPADVTKVAWIRNQTDEWVEQHGLALFDLVLGSSQASLDRIAATYPGPTALLPIGVDAELFSEKGASEERRGVISTVNQWGRERELFAFLKEKTPKFQLALFGQQRGVAPELQAYARGPVSFFSLPSLYQRARIVLDDFNHTTAPHGNVNSRLFEALASGALVLTNRAGELKHLGLGAVPVFSTARELFDLIEDHLDQPEPPGTVEEMQKTVLEKHTYQQRAVEFVQHLGKIGDQQTDDAVVISYYPDYRDNPYTEMMWSGLRQRRSVALPVGNELNFTATVRAAERRPTVFHLNWTAPILGGAKDEHDRLVRHRRFLEAIDEMHERGIPSVWTIHNVLPHECADRELEAQLRQEIADRVDIIHVMCEDTVAACAEWYQLPQSKVRVIPHPSYIDIYPNLVDRATARHELGLGTNDFVYLHFGQIRPYKGIDRLLDAFDNVAQIDAKAKLLLVGKPGRFEGIRPITDRARAHPQIVESINPVPDADVQLYMNAADVAVLPHRAVLNSGALLLAYSFALPVVAPDTGCLGGLVDASTGVTFPADGGRLALQNAMLAARDLTRDHGRSAHERAGQLHYLDISRQFSELVEGML